MTSFKLITSYWSIKLIGIQYNILLYSQCTLTLKKINPIV